MYAPHAQLLACSPPPGLLSRGQLIQSVLLFSLNSLLLLFPLLGCGGHGPVLKSCHSLVLSVVLTLMTCLAVRGLDVEMPGNEKVP